MTTLTTTTHSHEDPDLAIRLEGVEARANTALIETRMRLQPGSGAARAEIGGVQALFDGADSPLTQTFGLGVAAPPTAEELDTVEAFFIRRSAAVCHEVAACAQPAVAPLLRARGYEPIEESSVMYLRLAPSRRAPDDDLPAPLVAVDSGAGTLSVHPLAVCARVIEPDEAELWAEVAAAGWSSESAELGAAVRDLGRVIARCPGFHCFLAELDGWPIAAGTLVIADRVALLAGASTVPWRRRWGAQAALLEARLQFAARHGCDLAMIVTPPGSGSRRNAERRGFRVAYGRTKWRLALRTP